MKIFIYYFLKLFQVDSMWDTCNFNKYPSFDNFSTGLGTADWDFEF